MSTGRLTVTDALATRSRALLVKARQHGCDGPAFDAVELALEDYARRGNLPALATASERMVQFLRRRGPAHLSLACAQLEQQLEAVR